MATAAAHFQSFESRFANPLEGFVLQRHDPGVALVRVPTPFLRTTSLPIAAVILRDDLPRPQSTECLFLTTF